MNIFSASKVNHVAEQKGRSNAMLNGKIQQFHLISCFIQFAVLAD